MGSLVHDSLASSSCLTHGKLKLGYFGIINFSYGRVPFKSFANLSCGMNFDIEMGT